MSSPTPEASRTPLHIGELIRAEVRRQRFPVTVLAGRLCCDRTNIYKIFARQSIDTDLLRRISAALDHDFFADISGIPLHDRSEV